MSVALKFKALIPAAICCTTLMLSPVTSQSAEVVKVGGYPFLPFVDGKQGVAFDLIAAMNEYQKDYKFEFESTSANLRFQHMDEGKFNVILFESLNWGWDAKKVDASDVFLSGDGEVYVTKAGPGKSQAYFDKIGDKRIIANLGYHYAFANYSADQEELKKKFKITFVTDSANAVPLVLAERGDVAVVTKSYLQGYLQKAPENKAALLVSDKMDQSYNHTILVKKGTKPTVQDINKMLAGMEKAGLLKKVWAKNGITN